MNHRKEELKASALWTFIERLRQEGSPLVAGLDGLTPSDAEELAGLLRTAERLQAAIASVEPVEGQVSRARVRAAIAARRAATAPPSPEPLTHPPAAVAALSHAETRARVPRLLTGSLPAPEARAVLWHLAHCDECFSAYERMRQVSEKPGREWRMALLDRERSFPPAIGPLHR